MTEEVQGRRAAQAAETVTFDPRATIEEALATANDSSDDELEWDERELVLLGVVDRQAHHIRELEKALALHGYIDTGSKGQVRVSPIVAELRQQYAGLVRTVEAVRLPDEVGPKKSIRHQRAASRRWKDK